MIRSIALSLALVVGFTTASPAADKETPKVSSPLDFKMKDIAGKEVELTKYKGKVVLVVNVASKCGLTPQYEGLQALYDQYGKDGLVIVGVPANEFGKQEPGTDADIQKFCSTNYKVTFPMLSKIVVKGEGQHPLYALLTDNDAKPITWNFEKFLINRKGEVVERFAPRTTPDKLTTAIEKELAAK